MLNDYVRVEIKGKPMENVMLLPREYMRGSNQTWVFSDNVLDIRDVHIVFQDDTHVYIDRGIGPEDCIITSGLSGVTPSMALRTTADNEASKTGKQGQTP